MLAKKGGHSTLARASGSYDLRQPNQSHACRTHLHSLPYGTSDLKNVAKKTGGPTLSLEDGESKGRRKDTNSGNAAHLCGSLTRA